MSENNQTILPKTKLETKTKAKWNFDNSYLRLSPFFYKKLNPASVRKPELVVFNTALAEALGLDFETSERDQLAAFLAGNKLPEGAEPIAQAYAGHQFGHFTMLGDGRAILLGEQLTPDGRRFDIQLKGSGQTPFSRRGDGRAALGPMLREYIISEAMHALGIPTTRSLAVTATGETVYRDTPLPGAVLTRTAASHIRVGTFEYVSSWGRDEDLKALADYTIARHYPELQGRDTLYLDFLKAVMERQAALVAKWQLVGFIHGVMNTDNMAISGETIDYGPCAFMDAYNPATVFSSIDVRGRYAYGQQPIIAQWNLARLTETLLPLLHSEPETALAMGKEALAQFPERFEHYWLSGMRAKLGLISEDNTEGISEEDEDRALIADLLAMMQQHQADFTNTFRVLSAEGLGNLPTTDLFASEAFVIWYSRLQARWQRQGVPMEARLERMRAHNPSVIPRNHRVEEALQAATEQGDFTVLHRLLAVLQAPYQESEAHERYRQPPEPTGTPYQTFCGT